MQQAEFSIEDVHIDFLNEYRTYGFEDKSTMVRSALNLLKKVLEVQRLKQSAELYVEIYAEDSELKELTETAMPG